MKKYLILECGYDNEKDRKEQEKIYHLVIANLDNLEEGDVNHNSYYIIIGDQDNLEAWVRKCYQPFDKEEWKEIMEDMKDLEI